MLWHGKNFRGFLNKASQVLFNKTGTTLNSTNVQDAICEINSNLTKKHQNATFDSDGEIYIQKVGNVTSIEIRKNSVPTDGVKYTLPEIYRPLRQVAGRNYRGNGNVTISSIGELALNDFDSWCRVLVTYIN